MAEFTLNRNAMLRTLKGHSVDFKKGVPTYVPDAIIREVIAIGAVRIDAEQDEGLDESRLPTPPEGDVRAGEILACIAALVERNGREDFTAQGFPSTRAMRDVLGFDVPSKERDALWQQFTEQQAEAELQK